MLTWMQADVEDLLTAASVLVAAATWAVSHYGAQKAERVAYTSRVIADLSLNDGLAAADFRMAALIRAHQPLDERTLDPETDRHVTRLLDYYEYILELRYSGVLDARTIERLRGGAIRGAHTVCSAYIDARRKKLNVPGLYERFCSFATAPPEIAPQSKWERLRSGTKPRILVHRVFARLQRSRVPATPRA